MVWRGEAPSKLDGRHTFTWDGRTTDGGTAPDGLYGLRVTALGDKLAPIPTRTFVQGEVTGVENDNGETLLYLGKTEVPMTSVVSVKPKAETADENPSLASSLASKARSVVTSPISAAAKTFASVASLVL